MAAAVPKIAAQTSEHPSCFSTSRQQDARDILNIQASAGIRRVTWLWNLHAAAASPCIRSPAGNVQNRHTAFGPAPKLLSLNFELTVGLTSRYGSHLNDCTPVQSFPRTKVQEVLGWPWPKVQVGRDNKIITVYGNN